MAELSINSSVFNNIDYGSDIKNNRISATNTTVDGYEEIDYTDPLPEENFEGEYRSNIDEAIANNGQNVDSSGVLPQFGSNLEAFWKEHGDYLVEQFAISALQLCVTSLFLKGPATFADKDNFIFDIYDDYSDVESIFKNNCVKTSVTLFSDAGSFGLTSVFDGLKTYFLESVKTHSKEFAKNYLNLKNPYSSEYKKWLAHPFNVNASYNIFNPLISELGANIGVSVFTEFVVDITKDCIAFATTGEMDGLSIGADLYAGSIKGIFTTIGGLIAPGSPWVKVVASTTGKVVADLLVPLYHTEEGLIVGAGVVPLFATGGACAVLLLASNPAGWAVGAAMLVGTAVGICFSLFLDYTYFVASQTVKELSYPFAGVSIGCGVNSIPLDVTDEGYLRRWIDGNAGDVADIIFYLGDSSVSEPIGYLRCGGYKIYLFNLGQEEIIKSMFPDKSWTYYPVF